MRRRLHSPLHGKHTHGHRLSGYHHPQRYTRHECSPPMKNQLEATTRPDCSTRSKAPHHFRASTYNTTTPSTPQESPGRQAFTYPHSQTLGWPLCTYTPTHPRPAHNTSTGCLPPRHRRIPSQINMATSHQTWFLQLMAWTNLHAGSQILPNSRCNHPRPHGPTTSTHQIYHARNIPSADFPRITTAQH